MNWPSICFDVSNSEMPVQTCSLGTLTMSRPLPGVDKKLQAAGRRRADIVCSALEENACCVTGKQEGARAATSRSRAATKDNFLKRCAPVTVLRRP